MDNTPLGEMELEQIPKEFQKDKHQHKSPWAFIIIIIVLIIFGIFWITENKKSTTVITVVPIETPKKQLPGDTTSDLEASIGSIDIPSYSDQL